MSQHRIEPRADQERPTCLTAASRFPYGSLTGGHRFGAEQMSRTVRGFMTSSDNRADLARLFVALFDERGRPRQQWLSVIESRIFPEVRSGIPDVVHLVFDELSGTYIEQVSRYGLKHGLTAYGWLAKRFAWDTGRCTSTLAHAYLHDPLGHEHQTTLRNSHDGDAFVVDDVRSLLAAIRLLMPRLEQEERRAFEARLKSGFDARRTYELLRLAPGDRNAHNNAWLAARRKVGRWLAESGWAA
jgi:hypothetical protein